MTFIPIAAEIVYPGVMKPRSRHNSNGISSSSLSANSVGTTNLVLILTSLIGYCEAQSNGSGSSSAALSFILPVVIVGVVGCIMFFIICACVCAIICFTAGRSSQPSYRTRTVQHTYSAQQQRRSQAAGRPATGGSYPVQSQRYPQSSSAPYPTSNTVPEEPVFLPEATLHHGDAPPGYEEAIRMSTVGNVVVS